MVICADAELRLCASSQKHKIYRHLFQQCNGTLHWFMCNKSFQCFSLKPYTDAGCVSISRPVHVYVQTVNRAYIYGWHWQNLQNTRADMIKN